MDVHILDGGFEVSLRGTREEYRQLGECSLLLAQVVAEQERLEQKTAGFDDEKLRAQLASVPHGVEQHELTVEKGRALNLLRGVNLMVGRLDQRMTEFGSNARVVTDPLTTRRAGFMALQRQMSPTLEKLKQNR